MLRSLYPTLEYIAVDGGINEMTGGLSVLAGANVLIAGTSIFGKDRKRVKKAENGADLEIDESISVKSQYRKLLEIILKNGH